MKPTISVIVPVYNTEEYLPQCIDSVLNQTYGDFELILIDDGSRDRSWAICQKYMERDGRVRGVSRENSGVSSGRNEGLDLSQGEYILFLDSDDYLEERTLEKCLERILRDGSDMVVFDMFLKTGKNEEELRDYPFETMEAEEFLRLFFDGKIFPFSCNKFMKKKLFEGIWWPDGKKCSLKLEFAEDRATVPRILLNAKKISKIEEPLYHYLKHEKAATSNITPEMIRNYRGVFQIIEEYFHQRGEYSKYERALFRHRLRHELGEIFQVGDPADRELETRRKKLLEFMKRCKGPIGENLDLFTGKQQIFIRLLLLFPNIFMFKMLNRMLKLRSGR